MNVKTLLIGVLGLAAACSSGENKPAPGPAEEPVTEITDHSRRFPSRGRLKMELVENHVMGKAFLPGGNVCEYERGSETYYLFAIETRDATTASILLFEYSGELSDSKYLAHMGGYFGIDNGQPTLVLAKQKWLAGVVGLSERDADAAARDLASRLD